MGGKSKSVTVGYWYLPAWHGGLGAGPLDAFLEFRGGDRTAWRGELKASGTIRVDAPNLWGGEKDQGGIVGDLEVLFGEDDQQPPAYLLANFGSQVPAWRGLATVIWRGGKYGAMNPYPHKPSYKIRRILKGWDGDCWYPEKAVVAPPDEAIIPAASGGWQYVQIAHHDRPGYENLVPPADGWLPGTAPFGQSWVWPGQPAPATNWDAGTILWIRRTIDVPSSKEAAVLVRAENGCVLFLNGALFASVNRDNVQLQAGDVVDFVLPPGQYVLTVKAFDEHPTVGDTYLSIEVVLRSVKAMNPAHVLYYARTNSDIGREPIGNMNDASYRAAADRLHAEGFGICTEYDPQAESLLEFEQRICKLIGGSVNRSVVNGEYYLDLARGDYVLEDLPILTDDDILEFKEQPTTQGSAANSVSVRYFDPARKESIITPPLQALALIESFGTIHQVYECPEIPTSALALRKGQTELMASVTPSRVFDLVTTRRPYAWRPNQYFRLQAPKRRIADMVCILGERQGGTLKSGAIRIRATQDIYGMAASSFVEVDDGVDTSPPQIPSPVVDQRAFEAPYTEAVQRLSRADLAALPADSGFLLAVASDPAPSRDYTMLVAQDGVSFVGVGNGEWCPTALIVEGDELLDAAPRMSFTLTAGKRLDQVALGSAAMWGSEVVRVDALDAVASTITLGRACADTVAKPQPAGQRIWFYDDAATADLTEYSAGETINVKLLTNTGSNQSSEMAATAMAVAFDERIARPYPPGAFKINDSHYPGNVNGDIVVSWAHRDRLLQADQLVDAAMGSIGPEPGTTYTVDYFINLSTAPVHTAAGISGTSDTWAPPGDGVYRIELRSVRDGLDSSQRHVHLVNRGGALWSPAYLAVPPQVWFDDLSSITDVSGAASQWADRSGNAFHYGQSTAGYRPLIVPSALAGKPALRFNGSDQRLTCGVSGVKSIMRNRSSAWIMAIYKKVAADTSGSPYRTIGMWTIGGGNGQRIGLLAGQSSSRNQPGMGVRRVDGDAYVELNSPTAVSGAYLMSLVTMDWSSRTGRVYVDGVLKASSTTLTPAAGNTSDTDSLYDPIIGAAYGSGGVPSFFGDVELAGYLVGAGALPSSTEIDKLFGWAAHNWGLTGNLDPAHPYKTSPPSV